MMIFPSVSLMIFPSVSLMIFPSVSLKISHSVSVTMVNSVSMLRSRRGNLSSYRILANIIFIIKMRYSLQFCILTRQLCAADRHRGLLDQTRRESKGTDNCYNVEAASIWFKHILFHGQYEPEH
jgi:hypothetical protein